MCRGNGGYRSCAFFTCQGVEWLWAVSVNTVWSAVRRPAPRWWRRPLPALPRTPAHGTHARGPGPWPHMTQSLVSPGKLKKHDPSVLNQGGSWLQRLLLTWHGAWLCGAHRTCQDSSSFKWHQPRNNQTALQVHHFSGYSKCAVIFF